MIVSYTPGSDPVLDAFVTYETTYSLRFDLSDSMIMPLTCPSGPMSRQWTWAKGKEDSW